MRMSICILLLAIVLFGPSVPPSLLPSRSGPATRAGMRARCSVVISPAAWPSRCPQTPSWRMR